MSTWDDVKGKLKLIGMFLVVMILIVLLSNAFIRTTLVKNGLLLFLSGFGYFVAEKLMSKKTTAPTWPEMIEHYQSYLARDYLGNVPEGDLRFDTDCQMNPAPYYIGNTPFCIFGFISGDYERYAVDADLSNLTLPPAVVVGKDPETVWKERMAAGAGRAPLKGMIEQIIMKRAEKIVDELVDQE